MGWASVPTGRLWLTKDTIGPLVSGGRWRPELAQRGLLRLSLVGGRRLLVVGCRQGWCGWWRGGRAADHHESVEHQGADGGGQVGVLPRDEGVRRR
jgi:hypothetical protein